MIYGYLCLQFRLSFARKSSGEIKKVRVMADGNTMKPKKDDYDIIKKDSKKYFKFKNNYKGVVPVG